MVKECTDSSALACKSQRKSSKAKAVAASDSTDKDCDSDLIEKLFREVKTSKKKRQPSAELPNSSDSQFQSSKRRAAQAEQGGASRPSRGGTAPAAAGESYGLIKSEYGDGFIVSPEAPLERIDAESGLPVYKAHLLRVGEGGGTALCPFDCDCCF